MALSAMEIKQRGTQLTPWTGFHEGIVSNQNQAEETHMTHSLDGILCKHYQQWKLSRGGTQLTC